MSNKSIATIATGGIDIGKNSFHVVGLDRRGAIVLRQKWSRGQIEARLANMPPCLIGMEACVGAHHLSRKLQALGHDARLMPAKYVRAYSKGHKNDFRDAEAIAEAVQHPTMKFVATKTADQLDLRALHRVRERLVRQRTGIINQIRAFLLERGIAVRQGLRFLRTELPGILAKRSDVLSPRVMRIIEDLAGDWRRLGERIEGLSADITSLVEKDPACERLMTVPASGQSSRVPWWRRSAMAKCSKGRDFAAWLGLVPQQRRPETAPILDAHYLHRDPELARAAIHKLEIGYARRAMEVRTGTESSNSQKPRNHSARVGPLRYWFKSTTVHHSIEQGETQYFAVPSLESTLPSFAPLARSPRPSNPSPPRRAFQRRPA